MQALIVCVRYKHRLECDRIGDNNDDDDDNDYLFIDSSDDDELMGDNKQNNEKCHTHTCTRKQIIYGRTRCV